MASAANGAKPINSAVASSPMAMNFMFVFPYLFPVPVIEIFLFIFSTGFIRDFPSGPFS